MRLSYLKKLVKLLEESEVEELEVYSFGRKVRIRKNIYKFLKNSSKNISNWVLRETKTEKQINLIEDEKLDKSPEYFVLSYEIGSFKFLECELKPGMILEKNAVFGYCNSVNHDTELKIGQIDYNGAKLDNFDKLELLEILVKENQLIDCATKLLKVKLYNSSL